MQISAIQYSNNHDVNIDTFVNNNDINMDNLSTVSE